MQALHGATFFQTLSIKVKELDKGWHATEKAQVSEMRRKTLQASRHMLGTINASRILRNVTVTTIKRRALAWRTVDDNSS